MDFFLGFPEFVCFSLAFLEGLLQGLFSLPRDVKIS